MIVFKSMKYRFLLAILTSFISFPAFACDFADPRIEVKRLYSGYVVNRSASSKNLARLGDKALSSNKKMMGLTVGKLSYGLELTSSVGRWGRNYCGAPTNVMIRFGAVDPVAVYIASDIKRGSCDDRVTVHHEMQHVSFIEEAIVNGVTKINNTLASSLRGKVFKGRSENDVVNQIKQYITSLTVAEIESVARVMRAKHASIDTDEAYARTSNICRGR